MSPYREIAEQAAGYFALWRLTEQTSLAADPSLVARAAELMDMPREDRAPEDVLSTFWRRMIALRQHVPDFPDDRLRETNSIQTGENWSALEEWFQVFEKEPAMAAEAAAAMDYTPRLIQAVLDEMEDRLRALWRPRAVWRRVRISRWNEERKELIQFIRERLDKQTGEPGTVELA